MERMVRTYSRGEKEGEIWDALLSHTHTHTHTHTERNKEVRIYYLFVDK